MAIDRTIASRGGDWAQNLENISDKDARASIDRLYDRLSPDSRGVLTLHNRSQDGRNLTLLRKSSFQLNWFVSRDRASDASHAIQTLLQKAGLKAEAQRLQDYLGKETAERRRKEIPAQLLREILEPSMASKRLAALADLEEPTGQFNHDDVITAIGAKPVKTLGQGAFGKAIEVTMPDQSQMVLKLYQSSEKDAAGKVVGHKPKAIQASLDWRLGFNEARQTYLSSRKGRDTTLVNLAKTEGYVVSYNDGSGARSETLSPIELRDLLKRARKGDTYAESNFDVKILGTLMPKAPGEELTGLDLSQNPEALKTLGREILATGRGMVSARILHRDIKPANALLDTATGKFTLIDPGLVVKQSQTRNERKVFIASVGTVRYMHPRVGLSRYYSFEADLHSFAATLLEKSYPQTAADILKQTREPWEQTRIRHKNGEQKASQLTRAPELDRKAFQDCVRSVMDQNLKHPIRQKDPSSLTPKEASQLGRLNAKLPEFERIRDDLQRPDSALDLVTSMFDSASKPVRRWMNQDFALAEYQALQQHPFLAVAPQNLA